MHVSEIRIKQIRVNQGLGVIMFHINVLLCDLFKKTLALLLDGKIMRLLYPQDREP